MSLSPASGPPSPGSNAPDYRRGYLRVPLPLWMSLYCRAPLTRRQLQVVSLVIRESWGWGDGEGRVKLWTRPLSTHRIAAATGLSTDRLKRDLQILIERGVLREEAGRYQLVPYPHAWKSRPSNRRRSPSKAPAFTAETSLSPEAHRNGIDTLKKRSKSEKEELSTIRSEDNSGTSDPAGSEERAALAWKTLSAITAFTGPLPRRAQRALLDLLHQEGIASVWTAMEPALHAGPSAARDALEELLGGDASGRFGERPTGEG